MEETANTSTPVEFQIQTFRLLSKQMGRLGKTSLAACELTLGAQRNEGQQLRTIWLGSSGPYVAADAREEELQSVFLSFMWVSGWFAL